MAMKLIIVASLLLYLCIGVIVDSATSEDWQSPSILFWIFWPIVLLLALVNLTLKFLWSIWKKIKQKAKERK